MTVYVIDKSKYPAIVVNNLLAEPLDMEGASQLALAYATMFNIAPSDIVLTSEVSLPVLAPAAEPAPRTS